MKLISLFLIAATTIANAQLSRLESQALTDHPRIAIAEAEARALRARGRAATAPFKPMVSLTGVAAAGDDMAIFATAFQPQNYLIAAPDPVGIGSVMAMWRIYTGGQDRSASAYSAALAEDGEARIAVAKLDVVRDVRVAYASAIAAKGRLEAEIAGLNAAEELLTTTQQMFEAGSAPEAFVLSARADMERARRARALAEAEVSASIAMLNEAVGTVRDERIDAGEWDLPSTAPETLNAALELAEARPEYRAAQARQRAANARARGARQSAYPELNLVGMGTGMATESESDVFYKVGIVLSVPLVDGGMRKAEADEMAAMAQQARSENTAVWLQVNREVIAAWSQWAASPEAVRAAEAEAAAAQEAFRIAKLRYQEGKAPQVEVQQAAATVVAALAGRAEANAFRRIAWANLMRAVGIQN